MKRTRTSPLVLATHAAALAVFVLALCGVVGRGFVLLGFGLVAASALLAAAASEPRRADTLSLSADVFAQQAGEPAAEPARA